MTLFLKMKKYVFIFTKPLFFPPVVTKWELTNRNLKTQRLKPSAYQAFSKYQFSASCFLLLLEFNILRQQFLNSLV